MPEAILVSEPEPIVESDQVHEPAPMSMPEDIVDFRILVEFDVMDWSPAHTPVTKEGLLCLVPTEIYDELEDVCSPNLRWFHPVFCLLRGLLVPCSPKSPLSLLVLPSPKSPTQSPTPSFSVDSIQFLCWLP